MKKRNSFAPRVLALLLGMALGGLPTYAGTANGGYSDHRVVAGDFNGDGWMDMILQALYREIKSPRGPSCMNPYDY